MKKVNIILKSRAKTLIKKQDDLERFLCEERKMFNSYKNMLHNTAIVL